MHNVNVNADETEKSTKNNKKKHRSAQEIHLSENDSQNPQRQGIGCHRSRVGISLCADTSDVGMITDNHRKINERILLMAVF